MIIDKEWNVEIIESDSTVGAATAISLMGAIRKDMPNAILINCHLRLLTELPSKNHGLDVALERASEDRPIIIYGFEATYQSWLADDPRFVALMGMKNVNYIQMPANLEDIRQAYRDIVEDRRIEDPLAVALLAVEQQQSVVSSLRHDLYHARSDQSRMSIWLERARQAGFVGDDQGIMDQIENFEPDQPGRFANLSFTGVFVDVEGTLINNGEVNQEVKVLVEKLAGDERPITVWTGGNVDEYAKVLRKNKIPWKICPKELLRGAKVEIVVDDLSSETFTERYGIEYHRYHQVETAST